MRTGITVHLSPTDRKRLQAIVDDRNSPQKHVWRARIVLATADGLGTSAIMRTAGVSKTAVWRWQQRFMDEGVDGLLRDKTRPARIPKLTDDVAERIVALTLAEPPGETTHWTGRVMAKVAGVSLTSVQRIWKAHGLAPHRIRTFKLSNDPKFAANKRIFFSYSEPVGTDMSNIAIASAKLDVAGNALSDVKVIFRAWPALPKTLMANEGGRIAIARDGTLFATIGDRSRSPPWTSIFRKSITAISATSLSFLVVTGIRAFT